MTLLMLFLKLIRHFNLLETPEYSQLVADTKKWEVDAFADKEDKISVLYTRAHKGVIARILIPFLFFFGVKQLKSMLADPTDEIFLDDE